MYLKSTTTSQLVEVMNLADLFDPNHQQLEGRYHAGEELQEPELFAKQELSFPSGEALPRCWVDLHYREGGRHH